MQLLVILLFVLMGGNGGALKEVKPIAEMFGGEETAEAIGKAEELCAVASAVKQMSAFAAGVKGAGEQGGKAGACNVAGDSAFAGCSIFEPLAPIANIADDGIMRCLSQYVSSNG